MAQGQGQQQHWRRGLRSSKCRQKREDIPRSLMRDRRGGESNPKKKKKKKKGRDGGGERREGQQDGWGQSRQHDYQNPIAIVAASPLLTNLPDKHWHGRTHDPLPCLEGGNREAGGGTKGEEDKKYLFEGEYANHNDANWTATKCASKRGERERGRGGGQWLVIMITTLSHKDSYLDFFLWIMGWANFEPTNQDIKMCLNEKRLLVTILYCEKKKLLCEMILNVPLYDTLLQNLLAGDQYVWIC